MIYAGIVTLLTTLLVEVIAVNSPQMTFFTPTSHETVIHLESKYSNSATLKLTREMLTSSSVTSNIFNKTKDQKISEFMILGPDYPFHGVSAIIQEMNLRTSENGCRDFVQFSANSTRAMQSAKICGHISREGNWNQKNISDTRLQRSYFSPDGAIHLHIFSDYLDDDDAPRQETNDPSEKHEHDIGIEIVFTSYTVCPNPANSWKKLKACSSTEKMSCIYSTLFCDSKIDCGFPGEFGIDEEGCYIPYIYMFLSIFGSIFITVSCIYLFIRWVTKVPKEYENYYQ